MRKIEATSRVGRGGGRDSTRPLRADRVGVRRGPRWTEVILREDTKAARKPVGITTTAREQGNTLCGFTFTIFLAFYVSGSTAPTRLAPSIRCSLFKIRFPATRHPTARRPDFRTVEALKRFTPRTSTPRTARPCPRGFQGPQVRPSQPHRATCQEGVGIEQTQSTRRHTCQHGWAALIRRRSKYGWAALIRRRSSCAERANSAESARESNNGEASRPALPNGLQIRVRLAIAIRE